MDGAVTWRLVVVLFLLWNYQAVFGLVINLLDRVEREVAPPSIPVYEGGALRAKVQIATAAQAQAVARYGAVALNAFREVENALANEPLLALQLPLEQKALDDRIEAARIATIQYGGSRDLLWVGQLQANVLETQASFIKLGSAQRANRVRLVQVLGGSFDGAPAAHLGMQQPSTIQPVDAGQKSRLDGSDRVNPAYAYFYFGRF